MQFGKGLFGWVLFIALAVMLFMLLNKREDRYTPVSLGEFTRHLENDRVRFVDVGSDQLYGEFMSPQSVGGDSNVTNFRVPLPKDVTKDWAFTQWLMEHRRGAGLGVRSGGSNALLEILIPLIPWLLIFLFIWFFVFRQLRKSQGTTTPGTPPDAVRVYVVNQPGEPPLATAYPQPPPPLNTPAP